MTTDAYEEKLLSATNEAKSGVDYSAQDGATCPHCATPRARITGSLPWEDGFKTRYHKCSNQDCPLHRMDITIKSVQVDPVRQRAMGG
ncbi:MAG: transcriptional regulator [Proteobacteria bacterium]|nr:transcriptional regulator [Pseudomonadota bacterium]